MTARRSGRFVRKLWRVCRGKLTSYRGTLFDGNDVCFKKHASGSRVYFEYGVGASTEWVARRTVAEIVAVDTSSEWITRTTRRIRDRPNVDLIWIDLGPVGAWGRPLSTERAAHFVDYVEGPWQTDLSPDMILIDGRFRVACFLTTLIRAQVGAVIVFDDYKDRTHYHVVERFVKPERMCGRQAIFRRPPLVDIGEALLMRDHYLSVMD